MKNTEFGNKTAKQHFIYNVNGDGLKTAKL